MILSELKIYLMQKRKVALLDMMNHFDMEADALRGMLKKWIGKGKVRLLTAESACGTSCCKCDPALTEIYEWIG
ncbi:MAG: FeoC-like transcriptional regulator [Gammaproteobacteria bacterium]